MRYWSAPPHASPDETRPLHQRLSAPGDRLYFVWEAAGRVVGTGGIHKDAEIGFVLHPDVWGQGLAREGAQAVISHVWHTTAFTQITADADPRNLASVGLLTRLGFQVTGFAHKNFLVGGDWANSVYFSLPRPDPMA